MPGTLSQIRPSFNRSLHIEPRCERLSADTGALVQREILERTGIIGWLTERLHDPRHPGSILYSLAELLRTRLLLLGQGWRDQSDADRLRQDPSLRVASRTRRGTGALEEGRGLASQPTLSRLLDTLLEERNRDNLLKRKDRARSSSGQSNGFPVTRSSVPGCHSGVRRLGNRRSCARNGLSLRDGRSRRR